MDRNTIMGMLLLLVVMFVWTWTQRPDEAELAEQQRLRDSIAQVEAAPSTTAREDTRIENVEPHEEPISTLPDSLQDVLAQSRLQSQFGVFATAAKGNAQEYVLENPLIKLTFSSKGAWITEAELHQYEVVVDEDEKGKEVMGSLKMLNNPNNQFSYDLPLGDLTLSSSDLYYEVTKMGDHGLKFRATTMDGRYLEHQFELQPESYHLNYTLRTHNLKSVLQNQDHLKLHWVNYLNKLEKNTEYERNYSTVYYKPTENGVDYCNCRKSDEDDLDKPIKWFSHANQFFNTSIIAKSSFGTGVMETYMLEDDAESLKKLESHVSVPLEGEEFAMDIYIGPNEYELLRDYHLSLESIIPYGWSFFGTINRWVVRPMFNFLTGFISNKGIAILILTIIVKLLVYPLTYRMLYSQSKMAALKPQLAKVKAKHKDDQQKQQMATMKAYQEFGVNPLGGCFPIFLQMPIWFALYRFFPASIDFRQADFLWATDLSSYDEFIKLGTEIPFYGDHVSLFTLIWVVTTLIYTYYNSKYMDMSGNPMAKYMQYAMPVFFLFFFNNFASGLTAYLCFSNIFNIAQTLITKNYIINHDKIKDELEAYKKSPKKKKGFSQRLQEAMAEQQRVQEQRKKK